MPTSRLNSEFFHRLPKTDLHCHLDGSLRLTTLIDLAKEQGVVLPTSDPLALKKALGLGEIHNNLESYLHSFDVTCSVMQNEAALYRIAYELVEDAALENVWHIEIRFAPTFLMKQGLTMKEVISAVSAGSQDAAQKYGVSVGIILCAMRMFSPEQNLEIAKAAVLHKDLGVVALDLAGPEAGYPAKKHVESFFHVLSNYMHTTIHAGEAFGPESIEHALYYCGAHRIGHGTRLIDNPALLKYVVDRRIPIEACLISNLQTNAVRDLSKHPARAYLEAGARVCLNTDNRLMSDTTMSKEFEAAHQQLNLGIHHIKTLILNGIKSAFLPHQQKGELLARAAKKLENITG